MDDIARPEPPPHVPPVEPELLGSAIFLFAEYLQRLAEETLPEDEEAEEDDEEEVSPINMRDVLDLFAEDLGTSVPVTLNLYMRVTALYRLLAASPSLARIAAADPEGGDVLSEDALLAFARLDVQVRRIETGVVAEFDARAVRDALTSA
ncbi:MAG TPA: hypothetical protein VGU20_25900 [Stellaceae bacterium]|nr:hypothetical protein [Stellaceae bacterium]